MTVFGNITLSFLKCVTEEHVKHTCSLRCVCGRYGYKTACLRTHGRLPHHIRCVLTKTLGTLYSVLFITDFRKYIYLFLLIVCKIGIRAHGYFKERRLCDIYLALLYEGGKKSVEESEKKRSDLEAVLICISTDYYLIPLKQIVIEGSESTGLFATLDLNTAAYDLEKIDDDIARKDLVIATLHTVECLTSYGHNSLEISISAKLTARSSRVTLYYIDLADIGVLRVTGDEFLNAVGYVHRAGKLFLNIYSVLVELLLGTLVCKHCVYDSGCLRLILG